MKSLKEPDRSSTASTGSYGRTLPTTPRKSNDGNKKKVAVTMPDRQNQIIPQLIEFDQTKLLDVIVQEICTKWNIMDASQYALRSNEKTQKLYITEKNRKDIKDGQILNLTLSAEKTAIENKNALTGSKQEDKILALRCISILSADISFVEEFVNIGGHQIIIDIITGGHFKGDPLSYALKTFSAMMEHGILSWDILEPDFIKQVADCINVLLTKKDNSAKGDTLEKKESSDRTLDTACLQSALDILESVVLHCTNQQTVIDQLVTPIHVIPHLENSSAEVQKNAIALINALFTRADDIKKKKIAESLQSKSMRSTILSNVIPRTVGAGMAHELYVLQNLLLNLNEDRMMTAADPKNQTIAQEIEMLRHIAFDVGDDPHMTTMRKSQNASEDYKKLGFERPDSPVEDFCSAPPGLLALDVMLYFAKTHRENYVKVVLENSTRVDEHVCPFVQASKKLTQILCDILHIGDQPSENGETYYVMFFSHDKPFEEFFSICIQLLNKTWREMKATTQDFTKVLEVVKEQITRVLEMLPSTFENFRSKVNSLTYGEISKIRENERKEKEGHGANLKPVIELRKQLIPEIRELIHQQRLNFLMGGTRFSKYTKDGKVKDKFWFWRLSHNHKALHYGECSESDSPSLEQLPNKLPLSEVQKLVIGKECPHMNVKDRGRRAGQLHTVTAFKHAFCLKLETDQDPFCFLASTDAEFDMWTDGLNYLLGNVMVSEQVKKDEDILLSMEIKMRMLDTEGVQIPAEAPPIPPMPENFNFAFKSL